MLDGGVPSAEVIAKATRSIHWALSNIALPVPFGESNR